MRLGKLLSILLLGIVVLVFLYQCWVLLHISWWVNHNPQSTAFMRDRLSVIQAENPKAKLRHKWVPYSQISIHLKRAVIASEDAKFVEHHGFDWAGIRYAFERNVKKGKIVAGGSTISQQLAKNLFLSGSRTPWRKVEEAVIAMMLEKILSKRRIYEIYLNMIEWGNGVFGAQAASRHYFHVNASKLNKAQAAKLAAMVPNPQYYDQHRSGTRLKRKARIIQSRMHMSKTP